MTRGPNNAMGASTHNGPPGSYEWTRRTQGWDIRPFSLYDAIEPRVPA